MLFIKYITDKYGDSTDFAPPVTIPKGASFTDMLDLRGKSDIGDRINTQVIAPLVQANTRLAYSDFPDFNDPNKLGEGNEMVERLTNLINIFASPNLDFSRNRPEHDDILGDAYEYLMRHFATESGKSKGQFYTPAEVSRVIAQDDRHLTATTRRGLRRLTIRPAARGHYCSRSPPRQASSITLEGQEKDVTTAGLARMNMILHDFPTANDCLGQHVGRAEVRRTATCSSEPTTTSSPTRRFPTRRGQPVSFPQTDPLPALCMGRTARQAGRLRLPAAYRSLDEGNWESRLRPAARGVVPGPRRSHDPRAARPLRLSQRHHRTTPEPLLRHGHSGLHRRARQGECRRTQGRLHDRCREEGSRKDGPKNRLREQDIHRIVDTFDAAGRSSRDSPAWCRSTKSPTPKNDFNLNLPRYIDSTEPEDLHDIDGHLRGGIPERDVDALDPYWQVFPSARNFLFESAGRPGYARLKPALPKVKRAILEHSEFSAFQQKVGRVFTDWRTANTPALTDFGKDGHPKELIGEPSRRLCWRRSAKRRCSIPTMSTSI